MLTEERARKSMMEAAKLAEDLRAEQDNTQRLDGERRMMEQQVKELQVMVVNQSINQPTGHVSLCMYY